MHVLKPKGVIKYVRRGYQGQDIPNRASHGYQHAQASMHVDVMNARVKCMILRGMHALFKVYVHTCMQ